MKSTLFALMSALVAITTAQSFQSAMCDTGTEDASLDDLTSRILQPRLLGVPLLTQEQLQDVETFLNTSSSSTSSSLWNYTGCVYTTSDDATSGSYMNALRLCNLDANADTACIATVWFNQASCVDASYQPLFEEEVLRFDADCSALVVTAPKCRLVAGSGPQDCFGSSEDDDGSASVSRKTRMALWLALGVISLL